MVLFIKKIQRYSIILAIIIFLNIKYSQFQVAYKNAMQNLFLPLQTLYNIHGSNYDLYPEEINTTCRKCLIFDSLKLLHPDTQLQDFYIYRTTGFGDSVRLAIQSLYFDSQPQHEIQRYEILSESHYKPSKFTSVYIDLSLFTRVDLQTRFCLTTQSMHLNLPQTLFNKIDLAFNQKVYLNRLKNLGASAQCLKYAEFQKPSYLLAVKRECLEFFELIKEPQFQQERKLFFAIKSNLHNATGILFANKNALQKFNVTYKEGKKCGNRTRNIMLQQFMSRPALIDERKFDMRIYLLIVSTNPLIAYFYGKVYMNKCGLKNVQTTFNSHAHICNTVFLRRTLATLREQNRHEEMSGYLTLEQAAQMWSYDKLQDELIEAGYKLNQNWTKTDMIPQLQNKFAHYFLSSYYGDTFVPDSRIGEYTACDFDLDDEMNFWLLECTQNANMRVSVYPDMVQPIKEMHEDGLNVLRQYTIAKYQRYQNLIDQDIIPYTQMTLEEQSQQIDQLNSTIMEKLKHQFIPNIKTQFYSIDVLESRKTCKDHRQVFDQIQN